MLELFMPIIFTGLHNGVEAQQGTHDPDALHEARFSRRCCQLIRATYYLYLVSISLSFIISNIKTIRQLRELFSRQVGDVENEWGHG